MGAVGDAIEGAFNSVIDAIEDLVDAVWDAVVEPILEAVFAIFGIEDETVVTVDRISQAVYQNHTEDVYEAGIVRAIFKKIKTDTSFFPNYMQEIYLTKARFRSYFRYGELDLYVHGLPDFKVAGLAADFDAIQAALDAEFGSTHTVLSVTAHNPNRFEYFFWEMQDSPEFYEPWTNTITHTDIYGATRTGWFVSNIEYNSGPDDYTISLSRDMETAEFLIEGPSQIAEGDTATFTIRSTREVPFGKPVTINFVYAGTAVDGVDYDQVASVIMPEFATEVTVDIDTYETASANLNFDITIDTIDNHVFGDPAFEHVLPAPVNTANCVITDDDTLVLTLTDVIVEEANTTISIDVQLQQVAPSGAFSVDYNFTDLGGITGGVDYDNTTGTLNFVGTAGEIQTIMVDIFADVADDDREQFEVFLENSDDLDSIDISLVSTVTIVDRTDEVLDLISLADSITKPPYVVEDSLIVTYRDDSQPPGQFQYWIDVFDTSIYSLRPQQVIIKDLEMMPLAILRKNKTNIDVSPGPGDPEYDTVRRLMQRIAFDSDEFLDGIAANPDIGDVDDAYLNFSTSPNDTHPLVSLVMYKQWEQLIVTSGLQSNTDEFQATLKEGDINNAIVWKKHFSRIGEIGVVTTEGDYTHSISGTTLFLRYQRTATNYDEIEIRNLNGMTAIDYQSYHEVALNKLGEDSFTFPVSWKIINDLTAREQMEVFQYLARLDFNAVVITHIEWYETEDFLDLFEFALTVVAIVLTVVSFGADGGSWLAGALAIIEALVVNYAIGELIIWIAEQTGSSFLAAVAGVVAAIYLNDPELLTSDLLMSAEVLTDLSFNFVDNFILAESVGIEADFLKAESEYLEKVKELEEAAEEREDIEPSTAVAIDSSFLSGLKSVDANIGTAIGGIYNYDQIYNYDSLVGDYYDTQLQTGVK